MVSKTLLAMALAFVAVLTHAKPSMKLDSISVRAKSPGPTTSPTVTTTPSPKASTSTNAGGADCFPASALVQLEDGTEVPMNKLRVGDRVAVGGGMYSEVFMFTHHLKGQHRFVRIETGNKLAIEASNGHYLWVNGALKEAQNVVVGDRVVLGDGMVTTVTKVQMDVAREGLYNPQTHHGDIVVNGIIASTYTKVAHVKVAHAAFAPLRAMVGSFGVQIKWNNALADVVYMAVDKLWA